MRYNIDHIHDELDRLFMRQQRRVERELGLGLGNVELSAEQVKAELSRSRKELMQDGELEKRGVTNHANGGGR